MKYLLIALLSATTLFAWADEGVDITDPSRALALHNLQEKLDSVSTTIMDCINSGEEHKSCLCKHKDLIVRFNGSVNELFLNHPDLKKLDLVRFKTPSGDTVAQSLKGIRKQASTAPSCS